MVDESSTTYYQLNFKVLKNPLKKVFLLHCFLMLSCANDVFAQLSTVHYIPPFFTSKIAHNSIDDYVLLLSTPSDTSFYVKIYEGTDQKPMDSLLISSQQYAKYDIKNKKPNLGILRDVTFLNKALDAHGLYLEATFPFFANLRGFSRAHGISITSKGKAALGTSFRTGHLYAGVNDNENTYNLCYHSIGIMATANNTKVSFSDFKKGTVFIRTKTEGKNKKQWTSLPHDVVLQKGESYLIAEAAADFDHGDENKSFGTLIESTKPIAVISGSSIMINPNGGGGYDAGYDQIVPTNALGKKYVLLKGEGGENVECTVVVATENATTIEINGRLQSVRLNAGDYYLVEGYHFDGGNNLYIETNNKVAVYQTTFGSAAAVTASLNFIPPLNDCSSSNEVYLSDLSFMGDNAVINVITKTNSEIEFIDTDSKKSIGTVYANKSNVNYDPKHEWFTHKFYVPKGVNAVTVISDDAISVSMTNYSGVIGAASYFSGFLLTPIIVPLGGKLAFYDKESLTLRLKQGNAFKEFRWYKDGKLFETTRKPQMTITKTGTYYVEGVENSCNSIRRSADFVLQDLEQVEVEEVQDLFVEEANNELEEMIISKTFDRGVLVNLKYKYNSAELEESSYPYLNEILTTLKKYTTIRLQVNAHTDCRGDATYNMNLSQKRADFVKQYLVKRGIAAERLLARGLGETKPLPFISCSCDKANDCSETSHALNRRSEFLVLSE